MAVLRSPYSHARIQSVDSTLAEALPGVLAVLDRDHLDGLAPMLPAHGHELWKIKPDQNFIAIDKVRFDGELVVAVAAEDLKTAQRAVGLIDVEYEMLPPIFDAREALNPGSALVHEDHGSNLLLEDKLEWGDAKKGFKEADHIFEDTYTSPSMFHHPMEAVGGCLAQFINDEVTLWVPISSPARDAHEIAHFFGIDVSQVRIRVPYIGGGFGSKTLTTSIYAALFLSRKVGRAVRHLSSAAESFRQNARHPMVYKGKMGVKSDGTITALEVELEVNTGAYTTGGAVAAHNATISAWGCYCIPNLSIHTRCAYSNRVPAGHTRATGKIQTTWGIECFMDSVGLQLGMTADEFRRKNVLRRDEFVAKGTPLMDSDYFSLMDQATSALDEVRGYSTGSDGKSSRYAKGRGMALSLRHGAQGGGRAYAMATVNSAGIVRIQHNVPEIGQGTHNMLGVVAAQTLGIPQSQVEVGHPDTALDLPFSGVNAQRTTMQMGTAVQNTCENLKVELTFLASQVRGGKPEEWKVAEGRLWRAENRFSFSDIILLLGDNALVKAIGYYSVPRTEKGSAFSAMDHWAPSAGIAEVEVNRETGEIRLLQFSVVADAGKALHYISAKSQVEGGSVMGIGHALFEDLVYENGQLQNADPFQYRLPVLKDMPESLFSSMLENEDGPGPFGSKGMSQTSIVTVAPAIGNAVYDAVGVRIRSLPITPEKILRGMGKLGSGRSGHD
jgi:CO/xanthine dehydrogenase Mo-binding subunit